MVKIIVEGPDNAGKSTLVEHLHRATGIPIVPGEGPAISTSEINDRVIRYNAIGGPVIFDRHPCVSQVIYNGFRRPIRIDDPLIKKFYQQDDVFFIYCRGRGLEGHQIKEHDHRVGADGRSHEDLVNAHHDNICTLYDYWALKHAHLTYRIGDDMDTIVRIVSSLSHRAFDPVADIEDFHRKFELTYDGPARVLPAPLAEFRERFMHEELVEYEEAAEAAEDARAADYPERYAEALELMLDSLVDEVYVVLGTAYLHGFDFREAWRRVHAANMRKVRALSAEDSKRGSTFDVVKPLDWQPPSHLDLVHHNDLSISE